MYKYNVQKPKPANFIDAKVFPRIGPFKISFLLLAFLLSGCWLAPVLASQSTSFTCLAYSLLPAALTFYLVIF